MLSYSSDVVMTAAMDVIRFVQRSDDRRVCVSVLIGRPEDLSEGCDILGSFLQRSDVPIGPSLLFGL